MFKRLLHILNLPQLEKKNARKPSVRQSVLTHKLNENISMIVSSIWAGDDLKIRHIVPPGGSRAAVMFLDSMTNEQAVTEHVIQPLIGSRLGRSSSKTVLDHVQYELLTIRDVKRVESVDEVASEIASGFAVLLVDGVAIALVLSTAGAQHRAVGEPLTEVVIRGSHEGFNEDLKTNIGLIRRRIRHPNLSFHTLRVGEYSRTSVVIAHIQGIADTAIVEEVKRRVREIRVDAILESGYIEQFIDDNPLSIFSTVANTERPDVVAGKLLEGRVAILIDGTPNVLTVPMLFVEGFQTSEDYYSRPYYASLVRSIRFVGFAISTLGPAIYVALSSYHQQIIPTPLLITMSAAAEGTPLPVVVEAFVMGLVFEILREAGLRLPRAIGQAVSIVGTLVIGQAAIQAGLVGAPIVITISITALASFLVVPHIDSAAFIRIGTLLLSAFLGLFGILVGVIVLVIHLASLRSFGIPYLSPFAPQSLSDLKDTVVRLPMPTMVARPRLIGRENPQRKSRTDE